MRSVRALKVISFSNEQLCGRVANGVLMCTEIVRTTRFTISSLFLQEYAKEEETLKAVYESVNSLVTVLKSEDDECQRRPGKNMTRNVLVINPIKLILLVITVTCSHL